MDTGPGAFRRARRPEHKLQRTAAILDAARSLALRDGLGAVSLAGIAARVGMHKSALLTYFGTREEIFLRVAEDEWREWAAAVAAELRAEPAGDPQEHLVTTLGRSLDDRPLLCQLLIHTPLTLERHVSLDAVRRFKAATGRALDEVGEAMHAVLPTLGRAACAELLTAAGLVAAGLWQTTHPPPAVAQVQAEQAGPGGPDPADAFGAALVRFARVHLAGLQQVGAPQEP